MPSYEDAHNRLANAVLILPIDYKNFIFGYCTHAGLRDFGGSLIGNIQERMEGKGKRGETISTCLKLKHDFQPKADRLHLVSANLPP